MNQPQNLFYNWLSTFLKDRGLQFSRAGFKGKDDIGSHAISSTTGFWEKGSYSKSKPPRWLFEIDVTGGAITARVPDGLAEIGIGALNTAQNDKAGLAVRILPVAKTADDTFSRLDEFEINALFMFRGALTAGSSSDGCTFNPETGVLKRLGRVEEYIFAALLGILPRADIMQVNVAGQDRAISYGEIIDAIQASVHVITQEQTVEPIPVFDLSNGLEIERLKAELEKAWDEASPLPVQAVDDDDGNSLDDDGGDPLDYVHVDIPQNPDLLGIDPAVYRQINAMLKSGKQHLMLYGPPGTGKTSLARWIATNLPGGKWTLITGSSDWSSQDIIGGYQPIGGGEVDFVPGILLRAFDQPLIIDELNRCDIDKVIGPLFTVLSGQQTTLPYRTDISDKDSQPYVILPKPKSGSAEYEFAPGPGWRLIATINSIDKASLYQMSYALSRRFGWVYVDTPRDLTEFVRNFLVSLDPQAVPPAAGLPCPLADLWKAINAVRVIGPAPIIDAIRAIKAIDPDVEVFGPPSAAMRITALDAIDMVLLPMLDGIVYQDAMSIAEAAITAFAFDEAEQAQIKARLESVAI